MTSTNGRLEVAGRLRQFAVKQGGPASLAKAIGISPQQMNTYLSGRRVPGNKMQERLRAVGCDTIWLITGRTQMEIDAGFKELMDEGKKGFRLSEEETEMILSLRRLGIHDRSSLMLSLDETIVGDRILAERRRAIEESRKRANNDRSPRESKKK